MLWRLKSALPHHGLYEFGSVEIYLNCFSTDPKKHFRTYFDYAESRQPFDKIKHRHTLKEVGDVAEGKYDWKIKNGQGIGVLYL